MVKRQTFKKSRLGRKRAGAKRTAGAKKTARTKRHSRRRHPKRVFLSRKKNYRGGDAVIKMSEGPQYPNVYGIKSNTVYPLSKVGIPAGYIDPPLPSNGPNGNGLYYGGSGNMRTLLPQPVADFGRSITGRTIEVFNGFNGVSNPAYLNPMPYDQTTLQV